MATITTVSPLESWFVREQPTSSKFNSELRNKANTIITNHVIINNSLEQLLQGVSGGAQQAKISFALPAAPTGWTRDISVSDDQTLRVTDGSTLPPGANPIVTGGSEGGTWSVTGLTTDSTANHNHTLANHTHTLGNHTHSMAGHTHGSGVHTHSTVSHNHTYASDIVPHGTPSATTDTITSGGSPVAGDHTHDQANHTHSVVGMVPSGLSGVGSGTTLPTSAEISGGSGVTPGTQPLTNITGSTGSHNHSVSNDGTWRPEYLNVLLCKKD